MPYFDGNTRKAGFGRDLVDFICTAITNNANDRRAGQGATAAFAGLAA
jgi:hypothetical protein